MDGSTKTCCFQDFIYYIDVYRKQFHIYIYRLFLRFFREIRSRKPSHLHLCSTPCCAEIHRRSWVWLTQFLALWASHMAGVNVIWLGKNGDRLAILWGKWWEFVMDELSAWQNLQVI